MSKPDAVAILTRAAYHLHNIRHDALTHPDDTDAALTLLLNFADAGCADPQPHAIPCPTCGHYVDDLTIHQAEYCGRGPSDLHLYTQTIETTRRRSTSKHATATATASREIARADIGERKGRGRDARHADGWMGGWTTHTRGHTIMQTTQTAQTTNHDTHIPQPVYRALASAIDARRRCSGMADGTIPSIARVMDGERDVTQDHWREMAEMHQARIEQIAREYLPSGSGVDCGTAVDLAASTGEKIVLTCSFHHMDDGGGYAGWTEHGITVRASLIHGITLGISGRDRNGIKEYLHELYHHALTGVEI